MSAKPVKTATKSKYVTKIQPVEEITYSDESIDDDEMMDEDDYSEDDEDDELEFETDEPTLTQEQQKELDKLANVIKSAPKSKKSRDRGGKVHPNSGVVYIAHIPFGFYEPAMRKFFSQFGLVKKIRLSRSKRTGRYRGYGYLEFESPEIAAIVADTMDGYMMFGRVLQCEYIPHDQLHPDTFANHRKEFKMVNHKTIHRLRVNKNRTQEQIDEKNKRIESGVNKRLRKLATLGYNYEFPVTKRSRNVEDEEKTVDEEQKVVLKKKTTATKVKAVPKAEVAPKSTAAPKAEAVPKSTAAPKVKAAPKAEVAPKVKTAPKAEAAPKVKTAAKAKVAPKATAATAAKTKTVAKRS